MNLYVKNNRFWFELENLTRLFFPNEKINVYKEFSEVKPPYVFSELSDKITVKVQINDFFAEDEAEIKNDDTLDELSTVSLLYKMLRDYSQISQPWGLLTGVRPEARIVQPVRRNSVLPVKVQLLLVCNGFN